MRSSSAGGGPGAAPVFVDASGRRRRLVGRLAAGFALLGLGYAATLVLLALAGVHISAPGLPLVEHAPRLARVPAEGPTSAAGPTATRTTPRPSPSRVVALARRVPAPVAASATDASLTDASPTVRTPSSDAVSQTATHTTPQSAPVSASASPAAASPTAAASPSATAPATASPTAVSSGAIHGKSATAPGASNRPTASAKGKSTSAPGQTHHSPHSK